MQYHFPESFFWGTAGADFQQMMGVSNESIERNSDWFKWTHSEEIRKEGLVSGDLPENGAGFWDLYKDDLGRARDMNNNSFRFSIEWTRIFPDSTGRVQVDVKENNNGDVVQVSLDEEGFKELCSLANWNNIRKYREIFGYAKSLGLSVFLTLYHWPLPLWIHDPTECHMNIRRATKKGWLDRRTLVEFGKYAYFAARTFGDLVDIWETVNEPWVIASGGYLFPDELGWPPAVSDLKSTIEVQRNLAYAHTVAFRNIKQVCGSKPVGTGVDPKYFEPVDSNPKNVLAAENAPYLYNSEWYLNAIMLGLFDMDLDGIPEERRTSEMVGTDFIGVDYYCRMFVSYKNDDSVPEALRVKYEHCIDCSDYQWDIYPEGIREVCKNVFRKYRTPIYITENGIADAHDAKRSRYLVEHLKNLSLAIETDSIPIRGYYWWSLTDTYEWAKGFEPRFGIYSVDFKTKERAPTKAVEIYREICGSSVLKSE